MTYTAKVSVRLSSDQYAFLKRLAKHLGTGKVSDAIRFCIGLTMAAFEILGRELPPVDGEEACSSDTGRTKEYIEKCLKCPHGD